MRRTPRGTPTASPIVRDVEESCGAGDEEGDDVSEVAAPADASEEVVFDSVDRDPELVVTLPPFTVDVLVIVAGGEGGLILPSPSNAPRKSPGMNSNSVEEEQHVPVPLLQQ